MMKNKGLIRGIILGVLLAILVGFGACFMLLSGFGSGGHGDGGYSKKQNQIITMVQQKATTNPPDAEAVWIYAHLIKNNNKDHYKTLGLTYSQDAADVEYEKLLGKAADLGYDKAIVEKGELLIEKGLYGQSGVAREASGTKIKDPKKIQEGLGLLKEVLDQGCYTQDSEQYKSYYLDFVPNIYSATHTINYLESSLIGADLHNYPDLKRQFYALSLYSQLGCDTKDQNTEHLIRTLMDYKQISLNEKVYAHVLAKVLKEEDFAYLQSKKVSDTDKKEFEQESQALLDYFNQNIAASLKKLQGIETESEITPDCTEIMSTKEGAGQGDCANNTADAS